MADEVPYVGSRSMTPFSARTSDRHLRQQEIVLYAAEDADLNTVESVSPRHQWGQAFVFKADHAVTIVWNQLLSAALIYTGTIYVYRFAFLHFHISPEGIVPLYEDAVAWNVINYIVDAFFWLDLFVNFFLSYENGAGLEVTSMRLIAKRYLLGMFWLNLIACLPEEAWNKMVHHVSQSTSDDLLGHPSLARIYRLPRLCRLTRLARISQLGSELSYYKFIPGVTWLTSIRGVRICEFILSLMFTCHLLACGWYLTAALHENVAITWVGRWSSEDTLLNKGPFYQWLVSMYFILTIFTTVGFGDISAHTDLEICFVALVMIVGAVVHSIVISEVIQLVTASDKTSEFIKKQMLLLEAFANHTDLDKAFYRSIQKDLRERSKVLVHKPTFDKEEMEQLLMSKYMPMDIVCRLPDGLFHGKLCKNSFLQSCGMLAVLPPRLPSLLAIHLQPAEYFSGEVAYIMHDYAFNLGLVLNGTFAYVGQPSPQGGKDDMLLSMLDIECEEEAAGLQSTRSSHWWRQAPQQLSIVERQRRQSKHLYPYLLIGHNNYFGEFECLSRTTLRPATVRCESAGTALLLRKHDLDGLVERFPQFGRIWAAVALRREIHRGRARQKLTEQMSCRNFAATTIQRMFVAWKKEQHGLMGNLARKRRPDNDQRTNMMMHAGALLGMTVHENGQTSAGSKDGMNMVAEPEEHDKHSPWESVTSNFRALANKDLARLVSSSHAPASLSTEVHDLRCIVESLCTEYRRDMKNCRDDMKEIKNALATLLRVQ